MNQNLFAPFRANRTISIIFYTVMIVVGIAGVAATEMGLTLIFTIFDFG
jgi:hypothetical protein